MSGEKAADIRWVFFGFVLCSTDLVLSVYIEKYNKEIAKKKMSLSFKAGEPLHSY